MSYDEQPDGDLHGECAAEIHRLEAEIERLRAALLAHAAQRDHTEDVLGMVPPMEHERGRVPDLLDRISAAHDASLDDEHETCRGLLRECLASLILTSTAPSAPAAPAEPVKLPYPDKIGVSPDGISYHSDDCIRTYGDAREAAGYARGRAEQQAVIDRLMMEHCPDEMTTKQRQTWAAAQAQEGGECMVPPLGWRCTRGAGHDGPCAAVAYPDDVEIVERAMQRLRETPTPDAQKGCE